ncbi:MAG: plasmid mobilization relaxosome protein MobC [Kineothrix sp.]|nr:plasmid mobilization relaxosome protein MobC [Kineothrix sp.]
MQDKNYQYEANRIRNIQMKFRSTEAEKNAIKKNMEAAGYKYEVDFINDMCCNGFVINREYPFLQDLKNCSYELSKQGANINQIARKVNSGAPFTQYDFDYLRELLEEQGKILRFAFRYFLGD